MEVIVITKQGIMIQDLDGYGHPNYEPVLRYPNSEDLLNVKNSLAASLVLLSASKRKEIETEKLMKILFKENVKKYGKDNVRRADAGDTAIHVMVKDKEHKIWIEST